jgi:hypothetical protein
VTEGVFASTSAQAERNTPIPPTGTSPRGGGRKKFLLRTHFGHRCRFPKRCFKYLSITKAVKATRKRGASPALSALLIKRVSP